MTIDGDMARNNCDAVLGVESTDSNTPMSRGGNDTGVETSTVVLAAVVCVFAVCCVKSVRAISVALVSLSSELLVDTLFPFVNIVLFAPRLRIDNG